MPSYSPPENPTESGALKTGAKGITDTVASAVATSANRLTLTIYNHGTENIFFGKDNTVTADSADATAGQVLPPGGGFTFDNYKGAVWMLHADAGQTHEMHFLEELAQ